MPLKGKPPKMTNKPNMKQESALTDAKPAVAAPLANEMHKKVEENLAPTEKKAEPKLENVQP